MTNEELYNQLSPFVSEHKLALFERISQHRTYHVTTVLEDIYQSHNASAVVRTCEVLGIQRLQVIENRNAYTLNPDVTLGSSKWTDIVRWRGSDGNTERCVRSLKTSGYRIAVTSPHDHGTALEELPLEEPLALCFGTELTGASDALVQAADVFVRIPMYGFTESYNISVSAAIVLYTLMQRLRASSIPWALSEEERMHLKLQWVRKVVHSAAHIEARLRENTQDET
jgi:tRNA (guanosine-2'-O-)-methyltransferase